MKMRALGRTGMMASEVGLGCEHLQGKDEGLIREVVGAGTFAGISLPFFSSFNIPILVKPAGGFFVFGVMIAAVAKITHGKVKHAATGCGNCPNAAVCGKIGKEA